MLAHFVVLVELENGRSAFFQLKLDEIEKKAQAKNTKKATEWGVKKFEKWCDKRKLSVDFKTVSPTDVSEILRKFYAEVKTEKGLDG